MRFPLRAGGMAVALAVACCATGCLHHHKPQPTAKTIPPPNSNAGTPAAPIVQGELGIASWYGHPYHGRRAASGEIYNMYDMTAAHRTLPFGTEVRVHDLENGRDVTVRINDRGPFVEGRIIDLSYAAALAMGMAGPGIARVQLEILSVGASPVPAMFAVQVGAFRNPANADRLKDLIAASYGTIPVQRYDRGDGYYRVRVGAEPSESAARDLAAKLRSANLATDTFIVRVN